MLLTVLILLGFGFCFVAGASALTPAFLLDLVFFFLGISLAGGELARVVIGGVLGGDSWSRVLRIGLLSG
jgi:hypothetical protein